MLLPGPGSLVTWKHFSLHTGQHSAAMTGLPKAVCPPPPVFTVQDGPSPGREEDREAPREADETHGVQGDAQRCHGVGLTRSESPEHLD